ncbi:MAG TPA: hypothetical protein VFU98_01620 [Microlunatus sp.]|nr:hypothetical protein [Microlunatus sp.]
MLEYRIPAAQFVSGAFTAVCCFIALLAISMRDAGRVRTFGLLGATLVFASTAVQALNGSLAGAYGTDTVLHGAGTVIVAVLAAGGIVLLALAVVRERAARRARGDH